MDVEDRHVDPAGLEQPQRVGRRARRPHLELHALGVVVAARGREVDARVDAVRREVEQQRRVLVRAGRSRVVPPQPASTSDGQAARRTSASRARADMMAAPGIVARLMRRRVTFSRNVTLSLSRTCRCHCKYCAFATHQPHLHEPEEVERLIDRAARRRVKELLVLTGEAPDHHPGVRAKLAELGLRRLRRLRRVGVRAGAGARAAAAHQPRRARPRGPRPAARGDRLAGADARVGQPRPGRPPGLADQAPGRSGWRRSAPRGELRIPFTSGILVGIGESEDERVASLEALAGFDHLQEVILQNFVPHRRYYGEEPADIATDAAERFWRTGLHDAPEHGAPEWATPVAIEDIKRLIGEARRLLPGVGIQVPPNLADWWPELVAAGATDLGGLSANGDHISPEHPFPSPHQVRKRLAEDGVALAERLCVYPQFIDAEWLAPRVLEVIRDRYPRVHPAPRRGRASRPGDDRARPRRRAR